MNKSFLDKILCPACKNGFEIKNLQTCANNNHYGLLVCHCTEYPLVADIPILKTKTNVVKKAINFIRKGDCQKALNAVLTQFPKYPELNHKYVNALPNRYGFNKIKRKIHKFKLLNWEKQAHNFFTKTNKTTTATQLFKFYFLESGKKRQNAYDYFTYRFGQPRHLSALALATSIDNSAKPVLDLGCGFGHITRGLTKRHNVIGIDNNFYLLFVAKHWIAQKAEFICCEGDADLPFYDNTFCSTICVNSFHFFENKDSCITEVKRVIDDKGSIILAAIHHSKTKTKTPNTALSVSEYANLFKDMPHTMIADDTLIRGYKNKQGPALSNQYSIKEIEKEKLISLVAVHDKEKLINHGDFDEWPHSIVNNDRSLQVNPLYVKEHKNSIKTKNEQYRLQFPSKFYEDENDLCKTYLPHTASINSDIFKQIPAKTESSEMVNKEMLVANCVLLDIPDRYHE